MTDKDADQQYKAVLAAIDRMHAPLEVLALFKLADEFYTKEERAKVYAEYEELRNADQAAFETLGQARLGDDLTWEQRVKKYGEEKATEQLASHRAALDAKQATSRAVLAFERQHRIVLRLLHARNEFSKSRYD